MAWVLEEDGHTVLIQAWYFVPGSNWIQGIECHCCANTELPRVKGGAVSATGVVQQQSAAIALSGTDLMRSP
jgi:hypothetical protein